jgi:PPOX class probable FMN-dependent enzyme
MMIKDISQLESLYGLPSEGAKKKVIHHLEAHSIRLIQHSPFCTLATRDAQGNMDVSPRGGSTGFVQVLDKTHLCMPDAKGNKRLDSLKNIVATGQVGMLFMIPGMDETLRVNGKAHISTDSELLTLFKEEQNPPQSCIVIEIEELFLHCAKALMRSKLWDPEVRIAREDFPTIGQMLKDQTGMPRKEETQEEMLARYKKDL